jgi:hypothetical protein
VNRFGANPFTVAVYSRWLEDLRPFLKHGYHFADMLYWEERCSNWAANRKTETGMFRECFSPFNSRVLVKHLLSVDRKHRDKHRHKLYPQIIKAMSPDGLRVPVNPQFTFRLTRLLKQLGLYGILMFLRKRSSLLRKLFPKMT